ncbi:MAG: LysM peptidoglycan-binding domain-containing protein [Thermodesulfobacteriota bacterium]|nr:LysM peptidoglycan-binding domain-containing protein [Thermodesulfobacteriota bacterium]
MEKEQDKELGEIMEGIADDMGYKKKGKNPRNRIPPDIKARKKTLVLVGIAIVVILVLIVLFSGRDNKASKQDMDSMSGRLDRIEKKLANIDHLRDKFVRLEKQGNRMQQSIARTDKTVRSVAGQLDKIKKSTGRLQKQTTAPAVKARPQGRKAVYYKVRSGDSLYRIANKYGMSVKELCKLNHISKDKAIHPGQKLLVSPGRGK